MLILSPPAWLVTAFFGLSPDVLRRVAFVFDVFATVFDVCGRVHFPQSWSDLVEYVDTPFAILHLKKNK